MMANKTVIVLCFFMLSVSWIQAIPGGQETVEHGVESSLIEYLKKFVGQTPTPEPMTAKDRTLEDSTLRSITSAEKDNVSETASTAPMTIEDYERLIGILPLVVPLKMTQKKTAFAVLSPLTISLLAVSVIVVGFIFGILFYLKGKSFQKKCDVEQPPVQMSKLVETRR